MRSHHGMSWPALAGRLALCVSAGLVPATAGGAPSERLLDGGFDDPALASWTLEVYDTSTIEWVAVDATGVPGSGSVRLRKKVGENPNTVRVSQCFPLGPGPIELSGRSLVPVLDEEHRPYVFVEFYDAPGCDGSSLGDVFPSFFPIAGAWTPVGPVPDDAPEGTRSARLYAGIIATIDPGSPDVYEASWDDLSVVPEPASGAGTVAALALAALGRRRRDAAARRRTAGSR